MDKFARQDETAAGLFRELVAGINCEERRMFGYSVGFIGGNMFAGVFADRLFFRIRPGDQASAKEQVPGLADFEPVKGRRMKEYLEMKVDRAMAGSMERLVRLAEAYVRELPQKEKGKK